MNETQTLAELLIEIINKTPKHVITKMFTDMLKNFRNTMFKGYTHHGNIILEIWKSPVNFEITDEAGYYSTHFWFNHGNIGYIEIHNEAANPECIPIILIPLIVNGMRVDRVYHIIYNDNKYIGRIICVWPDNSDSNWYYEQSKIGWFSTFTRKTMEDFYAAYQGQFFSQGITRNRRTP